MQFINIKTKVQIQMFKIKHWCPVKIKRNEWKA